jgi:hypothetical protein
MNTEQTGFKKFKANRLRIYEDGYIGPHGWYWESHTIASFIAKAIQAKHGHNMTDVLNYTTIYVSELVKVPAGGLARGCHDTLYSVTALVDLSLELPTEKEIYAAYKHNNAHFIGVEAIKGGYHFYSIW